MPISAPPAGYVVELATLVNIPAALVREMFELAPSTII
jgi:hypothetical protein